MKEPSGTGDEIEENGIVYGQFLIIDLNILMICCMCKEQDGYKQNNSQDPNDETCASSDTVNMQGRLRA